MRRSMIKIIILWSILLSVNGCSHNNAGPMEPVTGETVEFPIPIIEEPTKVTNEEMKIFFSEFLTINQESICLLNQKPKAINDTYWKIYSVYESEVNEIIGDYLAADAKAKLQKQYLHDDFHFPRFIEINDYMITGISNVLEANIITKRVKEETTLYEVEVTGIADVIDLDWANKKYRWNDEKGYYRQAIFLEANDYLQEEPGKDQIKVVMNYFVEVPNEDKFTVKSVREKTNLYLGIDEKGHLKNNGFISRRPFLDTVIAGEEVIHAFLNSFMKQDYSFYNYYRKVRETNYDLFRIVLESDLKLNNLIKLDEKDYKTQFEPSIIPLKDNMESLSFDVKEDAQITPHVSSSANRSTYQVVLEANVLLLNGQMFPYEYTYLFVLDKELRISSVRLLNTRTRSKP